MRSLVPQASASSRANLPSSQQISAALKDALDIEVQQSLRPVTAGLAALYLLFAVSHLLFLPHHVAPVMAAVAATTAALLLGLRYILGQWSIPVHWSHPLGAAIAGLVLINSLLHLYLQSEPEQTTNVALLVIGVGCFFLSGRWLASVLLASFAGWAGVVYLAGPSPLWRHFGFMLLAAAVLSTLVHTVRIRTLRQLELMHILDKRRQLELEEAMHFVQQSGERFRRLSEASFEGVAVHEQGKLSDANEVLARMFGYTLDEITGASVLDLVSPESRPSVREQILAGYESAFESLGRRKDGTTFPIEICCKALPHEERTLSVMAIRDISERKRVDEERAQLIREQTARAEAEAANRTKDQFLATLSHELRTPLTAILGWAHMLRNIELDEETRLKGLEVIERKAREQSQLVDELLDVSRIVAGKLRLEMHPVELSSVVRMAVDAARPAADAGAVHLEMIESGPCFVSGDADRLQQVLWNLLSNAIKFTDRGGHVMVQLSCAETHARIIVRDTGVGIAPDFLPHVFDRFRQADSSATRSHGGLGLGLAIAQYLVGLHEGTIQAYSEGQSKGATFIIELPLAGEGEEVGPSTSLPEDSPAVDKSISSLNRSHMLAGLRVAVVDDEADTLEMLSEALRQYGAEVRASASAAEALAVLKQWKPDVLVSDIGMPEEDGFALIGKVRALETDDLAQIPAIALTAYAREEDAERALAAGYHLHVAKPVEPERLAKAVASLTRQNVKV